MQYVLEHYADYNPRRFGTPWAAPCLPDGRPDFKSDKIAHFSGGRGAGGDLFVVDPEPYAVYVYGQKDYRGNMSQKEYVQFANCTFQYIEPTELLNVLKRWETHRKYMNTEDKTNG